MFLFFLSPAEPRIPSGKHTKNYGRSPFVMGNLTISMAIFNSYFDITRGYVFLILFVGGMGQNFAAISRPLGWMIIAVHRLVLFGSRVTIVEDPRECSTGDSRASVSKKRHNESINDGEKTLELGFEKPRF